MYSWDAEGTRTGHLGPTYRRLSLSGSLCDRLNGRLAKLFELILDLISSVLVDLLVTTRHGLMVARSRSKCTSESAVRVTPTLSRACEMAASERSLGDEDLSSFWSRGTDDAMERSLDAMGHPGSPVYRSVKDTEE